MTRIDIPQLLADTQRLMDEALEACLPRPDELPTALPAAMRHALAGGKRLRPFLVLQAAEAFALDPRQALPAACAVEMMHCATLVHDDLPCIDDADLRHGRPALHLAFDEATALLAADALIIESFGCLTRQAELLGAPERAVRLVREFAAGTGARGLIVGEALDIETENRPYTEADLEFIHLNKTARLLIFSARAGAIVGGADPDALQTMTDYAEALGLLFQITDDLLDVTGTEAELGKPVGADAAAGKATYPGLLGAATAQRRAEEVGARATTAARQLPHSELWLALVEFVVGRTR
jgi:geranylgeranyl diphosphate synthase type II